MRVSSRVFWALFVAGVVPLAGCGSGHGGPDAGVDAGIDLEAYFGLQKGRCFEYTTAGTQQPTPDLGVVVEGIDTLQFPVPTWVVAYTTTSVVMRDYLAAKGNALVLYKREIFGGNTYIYDPPMQRLLAPLKPGSTQTASTQVTIRDGAGTITATKETHDLRVDVFDTASLHLPIGTDVEASKLNFAETAQADGGGVPLKRAEIRTFLKGDGTRTGTDGFVEINFNFNLNENLAPSDYKLQKVRDLGDDPTHATPPCGVP
jgi:hypothetical protein